MSRKWGQISLINHITTIFTLPGALQLSKKRSIPLAGLCGDGKLVVWKSSFSKRFSAPTVFTRGPSSDRLIVIKFDVTQYDVGRSDSTDRSLLSFKHIRIPKSKQTSSFIDRTEAEDHFGAPASSH